MAPTRSYSTIPNLRDLEAAGYLSLESERVARRQAVSRLAGIVGMLAFVGLGAFAAGKVRILRGRFKAGGAHVEAARTFGYSDRRMQSPQAL